MTDKVYPPKATVAPDVESSAAIPSSAGPCFVMIRPILAAWAVVLVCFCTLVLAVVFSMMGVFVEMIYENTFALDAHTVLSAFGIRGFDISTFREPDIGNQLVGIACFTNSNIFDKLKMCNY
jgi:hypothetical protein